MKAQQEVSSVTPSYGYVGYTYSLDILFDSALDVDSVDYVTFYPTGMVGATPLTVLSKSITSTDPLEILATVAIPSDAETGTYDVYIGVDSTYLSKTGVFTVYSLTPAQTEGIDMNQIIQLMMMMMVMGMMMSMMKGMFKTKPKE